MCVCVCVCVCVCIIFFVSLSNYTPELIRIPRLYPGTNTLVPLAIPAAEWQVPGYYRDSRRCVK